MPNILLSYLYRDEGNYKSFGSVAFSNRTGLSAETVKDQLLSFLINDVYFYPKDWGFPLLEYQGTSDWSELESVEETNEEATTEVDVADFLKKVQLKVVNL